MNYSLLFLIKTNTQKVFDFLTLNPGKEFIEKEIQRGPRYISHHRSSGNAHGTLGEASC